MTTKEQNNSYAIRDRKILQDLTHMMKCLCCEQVPIQLDHITPAVYHHKYGYKSKSRLAAQARLQDFKRGLFQALCSSCNLSKGTGTTCMLHEKYLGIWNYLPQLEDMESS